MTVSRVDPAAVRAALLDVWPWVSAPEGTPRPPRAKVAAAVRLTVAQLGQDAPGHSVEVRVPPFAAVQCVAGSVHRRGTPPNVVECDALTWLGLAGGLLDVDAAIAAGAEVSGAHATDIAHWLPVVAVQDGSGR
ncbi:MAG: sterol carrier family protein [Candidatus Corynebacterium faecigallinarum]|uniref:Bacterial SCP orthologue domain-containing protein n=1 Tax=Candidatus Corynebacterium faecigallinarum TaxID=2838528 RepID=A0A9D2QFZ4_9CORY|nr:hypothetical protein [Candidatus Corynebacterium faecigallinarum]